MTIRRIDGTAALSWPSFAACVVVAVALNLTDASTQHGVSHTPANLAAVLASVVAMFSVMLLLRPVLIRGADERTRLVGALLTFAVGAATRGLVLGSVLSALDTGEARLVFRALSSIVVFIPVLAASALAVDAVRTSEARRADITRRTQRVRDAQDDARQRTAEIRAQGVERVRGMLFARLTELRAGAPGAVAAQLRKDTNEVIRPLSKQMAVFDRPPRDEHIAASTSRLSWRDIWESASLGRPFRPALTALLTVLGASVASINYAGGAARGLTYAVAAGAAAWLTLSAADALTTRRLRRLAPAWRTATFVLVTVLAMVAAGLLLASTIMLAGGPNPWRVPLAMMAVAPIVVWLLALEQALRQQTAAIDAQFAAAASHLDHSLAAANSGARNEAQRLSRALHGPVQTAVVAAAIRVDEGDHEGAERLILEAIGRLEGSPEGGQGQATDALAQIVAVWEGICEVVVELPRSVEGALRQSPGAESALLEICTEACSNAVRHGDAKRVIMRMTLEGSTVRLVIEDDGAPTGITGARGLGTDLLDELCTAWSREREGARTVLRVSLPLTTAQTTAS